MAGKSTFLHKLVSTNWLHKLGFQWKDKIDPFKVDQGIDALDIQWFLLDNTAEKWKTVTPPFFKLQSIASQNICKLHLSSSF